MLRIISDALQKMFDHCRREYPNEACGCLAGPEGIATVALAMRNAHASPSSYEMDPAEQLKVQRWMREKEVGHIAIYHSHVATEAYPSQRDIDRATEVQDFFEGYYVLVTLKDQKNPHARVFRIRDGHVSEEDLQEVE